MSKANHALTTSCARCHPWPCCASYDLNTVAALIHAIGGHSAIAREFGIALDEPRRWELSGHIPPGWHLRVFARVLLLEKTVAPVVLGYPADCDGWQALARASALYAEGCAHG
jgi:hypothetical protein